MKKLFASALFVALISTTFTSCNDDDDENVINESNLPVAAKTFLSIHFANESVVRVEKNVPADADGTVYEVDLTNGYDADFTEDGTWTSVSQDNDSKPIPTGFINEKILEYIAANYSGTQINSIEKEHGNFEVELTNNVDLIFDLEGNFVRVKA